MRKNEGEISGCHEGDVCLRRPWDSHGCQGERKANVIVIEVRVDHPRRTNECTMIHLW